MKFSSGEKKMLAFCLVAIALPLSVGLYLNHINATPTVTIPAPPTPPKPNGTDLYIAAAAAIKRAKPEVGPASDIDTPANTKVRAQRYSLARKTAWLRQNQQAFALFERALQTPALAPPQRSFATLTPGYARLRQMARDKTIESDARWMRGDPNGALQSSLDTIQMGHDVRRGGVLISDLVGMAIGAIGRGAMGGTVERLDATDAKSAARRLELLLENRWSLSGALTEEKWLVQAGMLEIFRTEDWRGTGIGQFTMPNFTLQSQQPALAERWRVLTIPKQRVIDDIGADYDRQIANARLPYAQKGAPQPNFNDPFVFKELVHVRTNDARDLVGDQMLMLRLALHAYQLENDGFPPALNALVPRYIEAVPADPFGGGEAMRYRRSGAKYQLWSIGPDGADDGGAPIPPHKPRVPRPVLAPGERPAGVRVFVDYDRKGDVVAGVNG